MTLGTLDLGILITYFIIVLFLGLWLSRREKNQGADFFVGGRSFGWFAVGASLFASNISSEHLIGLAADGFRSGLAVGNYEWGAVLILMLLGGVFVPFYIGAKISTMPEFLQKRYGLGARMYLSIVTIVANVLVRISVALFAGGLVLQNLFGINMWVAIVVLSLVTVAYTAVGGLKAVVYTDVLQAIILLIGTTALTWISLDKVGGWDALQSGLDASYFDMVRPADDPEMSWVGLVLGVPVLGVWYWCTDQVIVQRVLGAKNMYHARMGTLFAAGLKILPVFLFVLPGLCGRLLFPEVESKSIFPVMVEQLLPIGLKGLVSAALIAALMSSIDSTLNSTGTLVSLDLFKHFKPNATEKETLRFGQLTTVLVMIFGILWVLVVQRAESLFQYLQQVNAAISPPIAACFLMGIFWRGSNHIGAMSALIGGLVFGVILLITEPVSFLVGAGINFFVSCSIIFVVSYFTKAKPSEEALSLTWSQVKHHISGEMTKKQILVYRSIIATLLVAMLGLWVSFA